MQQLDLAIFRWINTWPDGLEPLFITLSEGNKWTPVRLLLLAIFGYLVYRKDTRLAAIVAVISWPLANEVCDIFKNTFQMMRPSAELSDAVIRVNRLTSFGTASAHSANMMSVAAAFLFLARGPWAYAWLVIAILTGISRIYIGVHYPYQVLYGWAVGALVAVAIGLVAKEIVRRRSPHVDPEDLEPESAQL